MGMKRAFKNIKKGFVRRAKRSVKNKAKKINRNKRSVWRHKGKQRFVKWPHVRGAKRIRRVKRFPKKPSTKPDSMSQSYMLDWLQSFIKPYYKCSHNMKRKTSPKTTQQTEVLTKREYKELVDQLQQMIGNEVAALKKVEKENNFLNMVLEHTREELEDMNLPVSVRQPKARSINRLSVELIMKLCTSLDDDSLFKCRVLSRGFDSGYLNQEIHTASRAEKTKMKRLVQLTKKGRVLPNVSILLLSYPIPNSRSLRGIDKKHFPSMCELVVETIGTFNWSKLKRNPNIRCLTVFNSRLASDRLPRRDTQVLNI